MIFTDTMMKATVSGARSIGVGGWMGEECESAALERLARHPCLTSVIAYRQGRLAAIDELRFLTHHRRIQKEITIPLKHDKVIEENGFSEVLDKMTSKQILFLCSPKVRKVLTLMMCGNSQQAAGKMLGLSPSRTSQLITRDADRIKLGEAYRSEDE
jgi:hypothetical protein